MFLAAKIYKNVFQTVMHFPRKFQFSASKTLQALNFLMEQLDFVPRTLK